MAYKGKVIHNPYTGEILSFLETAGDTNGERLKIKWKITSNNVKSSEHVHSNNAEQFEIISGTMHYSINGNEGLAKEGDVIFFPKGVPHQHFITINAPVTFIYTATPALDMEFIIESICYKTINAKHKKGTPSFFQGTMWLQSTKTKVYNASLPVFIQKFISTCLMPLGKLSRHKSVYYY